jgi:hypothetical protein
MAYMKYEERYVHISASRNLNAHYIREGRGALSSREYDILIHAFIRLLAYSYITLKN